MSRVCSHDGTAGWINCTEHGHLHLERGKSNAQDHLPYDATARRSRGVLVFGCPDRNHRPALSRASLPPSHAPRISRAEYVRGFFIVLVHAGITK